MKKLTKILLILSVVGFVLGLLFAAGVVKAGDAVGWYMTLPAGAICFGAFMICYMLENEFARFDVEQRSHPKNVSRPRQSTDSAADVRAPLSAKHAH